MYQPTWDINVLLSSFYGIPRVEHTENIPIQEYRVRQGKK
jgi:hypothetical protein